MTVKKAYKGKRVTMRVTVSKPGVKSVSKTGDKSAVLLTWQATHPNLARTNPAQSAELKTYLAKRGDRKPTWIWVCLILATLSAILMAFY